MKSRNGAFAALALALARPSAAMADPAIVKLHAEGAQETIFEGTVRTDGHGVEQDRNALPAGEHTLVAKKDRMVRSSR